MGMSEDDKRNCCLLEIQETEAKYYRTLEDIEKVGAGPRPLPVPLVPWGVAATRHPLPSAPHAGCRLQPASVLVGCHPRPQSHPQPSAISLSRDRPELVSAAPSA